MKLTHDARVPMISSSAIAGLCGRGAEAVVTARSASTAFLGLLLALDLEPEAEVILPVSICQTMVNAVLLAGAVPVLADCGRRFELDPEATAGRLSPRTRMVVFHHPFGRACDLSGLRDLLVDRPETFLLEDCAQSPGVGLEGEVVGATGDAALFSFGPGKPIDAGVGGALATVRPGLAGRVEAALRVGRRGWPDDRTLGVDSTLTAAENCRIARAIEDFPQSAVRRIAKVQRALGAGRGDPLETAAWPPSDLYHRLVLDLGDPPPPGLADRLAGLDAKLWQAASLPIPPYAVPFMRARYRALGRPDLWEPRGGTFPVWRALTERSLLVRTDANITAGRLAAFCRALGFGR